MTWKLFRLVTALAACSSSFALSAASIQFGARQDIATGAKKLTGLAIADFNGDGKPDIVVTDDYSQKILVYMNNGTGGFSAPIATTLNVANIGGLGDLVAGDVNEDGKQDLIVSPVAGLQYDIVLLGNGDGTFTQKGQISTSYGFESASLLDINGDKHLDLVAGGNGSLFVHLGDGKGNFTQQAITSPGSDTFIALTTADFNGDKHVDFVTTKYLASQLAYFSGNGDGTFGSPVTLQIPTVYSPESLVSADFNGDGKPDLLIGSADVATLVLGNGDGTFATGANQIIHPFLAPVTNVVSNIGPVLATADLDQNGTPDIVAADDGSAMLSVLLNDGTGRFSQTKPDFSAPLDLGTSLVQLADLNGDGLPDIVLINYKTQNLSIFLSVYPKTTPNVTLQSSAAQTLVGSSPTVTVQVTATGSKSPTGSVTLTSGSTSYGQQSLSSSGSATFTLNSLPTGQYPLTATYSGDTFNSSASNATAYVQAITDFSAALPNATQTVAAGAAATFPLTLTPVAGFNGAVSVTCAGLPTGYTCAAPSTTLSGQASTINVVVTPPATVKLQAPTLFQDARPTLLCLLFGVLLPWRRRSKGKLLLLLLLALPASVGLLAGCSSAAPTPKATPYTGTSSFTITAATTSGSQTLSHQASATLVVH